MLQLISDGLVNREIGVRLFLSEETVEVARAPPAREAAGSLAGPRSGGWLQAQPDRLAVTTHKRKPAPLRMPISTPLWKSSTGDVRQQPGKTEATTRCRSRQFKARFQSTHIAVRESIVASTPESGIALFLLQSGTNGNWEPITPKVSFKS